MLTRDEVLQLILYLIVASALLLAGRVGAATVGYSSPIAVGAGTHVPAILMR